MKTCGSRGIAPPFLTSTLDEGEQSALRPGCLIPGETAPGSRAVARVPREKLQYDGEIKGTIERREGHKDAKGLKGLKKGS
jgi:hypothetical protein